MFLVCGEALMDVFAAGETSTGMALDARAGGSPFNVAVGLARLGQPVSFFGALSHDFLGARLMAVLRAEGVDTAALLRVDAPTTLGLVGAGAQGLPSYTFYGHAGADRQLGIGALQALSAPIDALHLGSFATVVEPIGSTLRQLVEREHGRSLISYDPNIRLRVEPDLARWRCALRWMLPRTHLLKISDEDLALLLPDASPQRFAADALTQGVRLVVVTRGIDGAEAWTASAQASVAADAVPVVDTVGAGDTFQAALLTWLAERKLLLPQACGSLSARELEAALGFAAHAAAVTCARRGADLPHRHELSGHSN